MSITENIKNLSAALPPQVTLVAVTKTKPISDLMQAYDAGFKIFGENYVQELVDKQAQMPKDIEWNMIGHLQSNKVKYIAGFVSLVHSVDSFKLLAEIDKQAAKNQRVINCLLQVYIAQEDSKTGMTEAELIDLLASDAFKALKNIKVVGLMGMASFVADEAQIRREFAALKKCFLQANAMFGNTTNLALKEISMGMSGDYKMAIEEGSTMIRVGSAIFGGR